MFERQGEIIYSVNTGVSNTQSIQQWMFLRDWLHLVVLQLSSLAGCCEEEGDN